MKGGIVYSNAVTTVSPHHAWEAQHTEVGAGLGHTLFLHQNKFSGILNGIDVALWNPATDPLIIARYDTSNFQEMRAINKRHLQALLNLPVRDDVPLIGVVSRITKQKGFDLAIPALHQLLQEQGDVQVVALGTGDADLERELGWLALRFGDRVRAEMRFDAALAQQIYAGCDLFLMPSHFEPCGIGQMLAMRYGALPLVRKTGGLADTVQNYDNGPADDGTGFVFEWEEMGALLGTLRWSLETYHTKRDAWTRMQIRAMETDFSWNTSAQQYIDVYQLIMNRLT
ncbi:MAG: glycosyltransferase [Nitrospiraceae bacterium]|nr:glycosyltransferase [Nitrospiraceae bacterium]